MNTGLDVDWRAKAACAGRPGLFFGPCGETLTARDARETLAKTICARCPATAQCLEYAVTALERLGVWGGLGESALRVAVRAWATRGVLPGRKICKTCGVPKLLREFSPRGRYLAPSCLSCAAASRRASAAAKRGFALMRAVVCRAVAPFRARTCGPREYAGRFAAVAAEQACWLLAVALTPMPHLVQAGLAAAISVVSVAALLRLRLVTGKERKAPR